MRTKLDTGLDEFTEGFLNGVPAATAEVWRRTEGVLRARAFKILRTALGADWTDDDSVAGDIAVDALMYVQARGLDPNNEPSSLMAMLNAATDWRARTYIDVVFKEVGTAPAGTIGETAEVEGEAEGEDPLTSLEAFRMKEGYDPGIYTDAYGQYLSSIVTKTPEDIALAGNLRDWLEATAIEACGKRDWDIYHSVVVAGTPQAEVADRFDISQQRVSQVVGTVGAALKAALIQGS